MSGIDLQAQRRMSFESSLQITTDVYPSCPKKDGKASGVRKGIRRLQQLIILIEKHSSGDRRESLS